MLKMAGKGQKNIFKYFFHELIKTMYKSFIYHQLGYSNIIQKYTSKLTLS